ncbi:MAG: type IV pilin [Candidatus Diapherotrites archaeon]|nr:type IV pilin [Candidatus Diapherotrites archaeon]
MKKGISPIVAVVLLIAIAVIAAVGLYFSIPRLTNVGNTPNMPIGISAVCMGASSTTNGTIYIQNTGTRTIPINTLNVTVGTTTTSLTHSAISEQGTISVTATTLNTSLTTGTSGTVWGNGVTTASFNC